MNNFSKLFDHTNLKPFASEADMRKLCEEAIEFNFKTVAINNANIERCSEFLKGTDVLVDAAVSFPLGQCTLDTKLFETRDAIIKGAGEVDYVINIAELKMGNYSYIEKEMKEIVKICREFNVTSKVIFENCYLTNEEKIVLCKIANEVKPNFIKTSTGFGTSGATIEDVKLMRENTIEEIKIKAAGGVRTLDMVQKFVQAGASRIGTSAAVKIMEEYNK
ncbi:deoxyribose-phosphate aldolase [Abyssisolibacter fermentans]|uniref:deoxyribose-phosphate aldolase n=1 Tax=Abyssisolibacter fermentans TaxID=1766203 RepID=UPI00082DE9CB|nr:deoxyribose-phosphate aldolase [Abyssisolibacter fermentans]